MGKSLPNQNAVFVCLKLTRCDGSPAVSTQRQVCQQQQKQTQQEVALHGDTWVACLVQACRK